MSALWKFLAALAVVFAASTPALAKRVALVIGISDYAYSPRLANPGNDARAISAALTRVGFDVTTTLDADLQKLVTALEAFYVAADGAEAALFYFAGHAVQIRGRNYLLPTDAQLRSETRLPLETVRLQQIVQAMEARAKITLTFLDACRDNPLAEALQREVLGKDRSAAVRRGLAPMSIRSPDSLVVFAAAPGKTASDGTLANSPFTAALLRHIETRGDDIELVMKRVTREVHDMTGGAQIPERLSRLTSDFSLNPIGAARVAAPREAPQEPRPSVAVMPRQSSEGCASDNPPISCLWSRP